jgi:molybdopterin-guanine dinucleotide biosynthesis protein A
MADPLRLGAVVLTGGTAARLDGADKASLEVDGVTLLERALHAVMAALDVVVVGEQVPTSRPVTFTREDPPHGGPAAGLLAGLDRLRPGLDLVCALAVDMPRVEAGTVARLTWAVEGDPAVDAACLVDDAGRRQPLAAVYRVAALQAARPTAREDEHGLAMHRLVGGLRVAEVPAIGREARDVDTWEDVRSLREGG